MATERIEQIARHAGRFVAHLAELPPGDGGHDVRDERAFGDVDAASDLPRGLNLVARVGKQDGFFGEEQQVAVAAGEAGEVAQIGAERHQEGVEFPFGQLCCDGLPALLERASGHSAAPAIE